MTSILVPVSLVSLVSAVGSVALVRHLALRRGLLDIPNQRSSHRRAVPRLGGIGIVLGALAGILVAVGCGTTFSAELWIMIATFVAVAVLGLADDLRPIRASRRFAFQFLLAAAFTVLVGPLRRLDLFGLTVLELGWAAYPFTVLWILWMVNLFNFMDGIDGIAGMQSMIACAVFGIAAAVNQDLALATLVTGLGAASFGFLLFNWPPASIFMGDVGSTALGFMLAALAVRMANQSPAALEFPAGALAVGPFLFDATFTLFRRLLAGERWYEAHRTHLYQRPQNWGVRHGTVTSCAAGLMVVSGAAGLVYHRYGDPVVRGGVSVAVLAVLVVVGVFVLRRDMRGLPAKSGAR